MGPTAVCRGAQYLCSPADHRRLSAGGRRAAAGSEQAASGWAPSPPTEAADRMAAEPHLCPGNMARRGWTSAARRTIVVDRLMV